MGFMGAAAALCFFGMLGMMIVFLWTDTGTESSEIDERAKELFATIKATWSNPEPLAGVIINARFPTPDIVRGYVYSGEESEVIFKTVYGVVRREGTNGSHFAVTKHGTWVVVPGGDE